MIRENQKKMVEEEIGRGEVETGSGLNQELSLARVGDTRWSSHHLTLVRLAKLYPTIIEVLEYIQEFGSLNAHQRQADTLHDFMKTFDFVYYLHLMKHVLGVTNTLSQSLQKKDQDIVNAVEKIKITKKELQTFRLEGFGPLMLEVKSFCEKYEIDLVDMDTEYVNPRCKRKRSNITNRQHYEFDNFNTVLDMQIQELNNRFNEVTTELLMCMCSLSPDNKFSAFDNKKLLRLAEMYPYDFTYEEREQLGHELKIYINVVRENQLFSNLKGISNLAKKMVETNKHKGYPLVYRLLKLALVLPVATASVERCFSSMKHVKTDLRNRMGDDYMNDSCICYIEKELFGKVAIEDVMTRFQDMRTRRERL